MLVASNTENFGQALELVKRVEAMPKPQRGDRKAARKLNKDGLDLFAQKNYEEAANVFIKAQELDPLDEEVVGSIGYSFGEGSNYLLSEKFTYDALLINPRRSSHWATLGISKQGQGKHSEALGAMWFAWQFSQNKQKLSDYFDKRIVEIKDENIKKLYVESKSWLVDGKKKKF